MNLNISIKRVHLLLKWQLSNKQFKTMQIFTWGVLFLSFLVLNSHVRYNFSNTLLLFAFIFSSTQLEFLGRQPFLATNYFLLPCSSAERISSIFLTSTVYYFAIVAITFAIANVASSALVEFLWHSHTTISWDFLTTKGIQVRENHDSYKYITIWDLYAKIAFIQAFAICSQFLVKKNSFRTIALLLLTILIVFTLIYPESYTIFKSLFNNNQASTSTTNHDFINNIQQLNSLGFLVASAIIWSINYSVLSNKQV